MVFNDLSLLNDPCLRSVCKTEVSMVFNDLSLLNLLMITKVPQKKFQWSSMT